MGLLDDVSHLLEYGVVLYAPWVCNFVYFPVFNLRLEVHHCASVFHIESVVGHLAFGISFG
jgi:hypothetical protein